MKMRIFWAFFFLIFGLGLAFSATSTPGGDSNMGVGIGFLAVSAYLGYTAYRKKQLKEAGADDYYQKKVSEADEYYASKEKAADAHYVDRFEAAEAYYKSRIDEADQDFAEKQKEAQNQIQSLTQEIDDLKSELEDLKKEEDTVFSESVVKAMSVEDYGALRSDEIKNKLAVLRAEQNELVRGGGAVLVIGGFDSIKAMNTQEKQILRCFNAECANIIGSVTVKNADASREKLQRVFDAVNRIFLPDRVQIDRGYLGSKLEELSLVYAYMIKEEEEKEQRRAIREQMVEEEKVRREIERAKQKIEKEEAQFSNEVKKLMSYMQKAKDDVEKQLYIDKIQELEEKLKALQADKDNVLEREQNTRAGFVYIISNIGSFGERVFKIGMTRRLEPMDRIAELSSASVPFPFDVHAMIFSEDAPGLETILHQHFDTERVNKVNPRKEFFKVDLDEIKKVVLENHNATVKFVDIPDATEYRETLRLEESKEAV